MNERSGVVMGALVGAALGGCAGYLFLTESGRRLLEQLEPRVEEIMQDLVRLQATVVKLRSAANEGWRMLNQAAAESGQNMGGRQSVPF